MVGKGFRRASRVALVGTIVSTGLVVLPIPPAAHAMTFAVTTTNSATTLSNALLAPGSGVVISSPVFTGSTISSGTFSGGDIGAGGMLGFDSGIVLGTGRVANTGTLGSCTTVNNNRGIQGPNACDSANINTTAGASTDHASVAGDAQLNTISAATTQDAAVLTFNFVPQNNQIRFDYVFSSEEYNEWVNQGFNDVFGFFVNNVNCALTPGTNQPVTINNINANTNATLYRNNALSVGAPFNTEMDGLTTILTCVANVSAGATNTMKLAIADAGDGQLDSNVFIRGGSFQSVSSVSTQLTGTGVSTATVTAQSVTVPVNTTVTDRGTVGGPGGATATGTMTYRVYSDPACANLVQVVGAAKAVTGGVSAPSDPYSANTVGTFYWTAQYSGDATHTATTSLCDEILTVVKRPTLTTYTGPATGNNGQTVTLSANLKDTTGGGSVNLPGKTLLITLGSQSCTTPNTDAGGNASCQILLSQSAGAKTITTTFAGDAVYAASGDSDPFTLGTQATAITYNGSLSGFVLAQVNMAATLTSGGSPLPGKSVTLTFAGGPNCSGTTDASGNVACSVTATAAQPSGTYPVVASFAGDTTYSPISDTRSYVLNRRPTSLTYGGPTSGATGSTITASATLVDTSASPIVPSGKTVTFTLGPNSCAGTTNASGVASCTLTLPAAGSYTVVSAFAGDGFYVNSGDSDAFSVGTRPTAIVYDGDTSGFVLAARTLGATLTDTATSGPVVGKPVSFTFAGAPACTGVTNGSGRATCSYTPLQAAGPYTVVATFAGDATYGTSTDSDTITLNIRPTQVTYTGPLSGDFGDTVTLTAHLDDTSGAPVPLAGRNIVVSISSMSCIGVTNAAGNASCNVTINEPAGPYSVLTTFGGTPGFYSPSTDTDAFTIEVEDAVITYDGDTSGFLLEPVTLGATLKEIDGAPIAGVTLTLGLAGVGSCTGTTSATGRATCAVTPGAAAGQGNHTATASFAGNTQYGPASDTDTVFLSKRPTATAYTGDLSGDFGDTATLSATLTDVRFGTPVAGMPVSFTLGSLACNGTTNASGLASCTVVLNLGPGGYTVAASFTGDGTYLGSGAGAPFTVRKEGTVLTYDGAVEGFLLDSTTLSATLTDPDSGAAIPGKTVSFTFAGAAACSGVTNGAGKASCAYTPTVAAGTHTVVATFAGDANYNGDTDSSPFLLKKRPTTLTYDGATDGALNTSVTLSATLTDTNTSSALPGKPVSFTLGTQSCNGTTNAAGKASCNVTLTQAPGGYTVAASFAGDATYLPSGDSSPFTIRAGASTLTYDGDVEAFLLDSVHASATLKAGGTGAPIVGETITFTLGGAAACNGTTDATGKAECTFTPSLAAGTYPMVASFAGNSSFNPATDTVSFLLKKRPTDITYDGAISGAFSDPVTLSATLNDTNTGDPLGGKPVTFQLGTQSCTGTTNAAGAASCNVVLTQAPGPYSVSASFAGDATYLLSSDSSPFTIGKETLTLTYDGDVSGFVLDQRTLSATLTDGDSGVAVSGKTITFTFAANAACSGVTDAAGKASCNYTPTDMAGSYNVHASFAGDVNYNPASDDDTIVLSKRPTKIVYNGQTSGQFSEPLTLAATLTDDLTHAPLTAQPITLAFGSQSCTATTNAAGQGSCTITVNQPAGSYNVTASYAGTPWFLPSTDTGNTDITITPDNDGVNIVYDGHIGGFIGESATLAATLRDVDTGIAIGGKLVTFSFDGSPACTGTTNASGHAECQMPINPPAGPHTVVASFAGDGFYGPASDDSPFDVMKRPTAMAYTGATSGQYGDQATLSGRLTDVRTGLALAGQSVTLAVGTTSCTDVTDVNGVADCTVTLADPPGAYTASATYAGTDTWVGSGASAPFTINKEITNLTYVGETGTFVGGTLAASAILTDEEGNPLGGHGVTLSFAGDTCLVTTDSTGRASCTLTPTAGAGTYPISASFAGNDFYVGSTTTVDGIINKRPTTLDYNGDEGGEFSDAVVLGATLVDVPSGLPLGGKPIAFTLGSQSCSGTTDASGRATCTITLNQPPGNYTVTATFTEDATHLGSSDQSAGDKPFVIAKESTAITYDGQTVSFVGNTAAMSATLRDGDSTAPIGGKSVTLSFPGGPSCTATTDAVTGKASCTVTPTQPAGTYTVTAAFAGDDNYTGSSDTEQYAIVKWPTSVDYNGATSGFRGSPATMRATLRDVVPNVPLGGATLTFTLGSQSCTGTTNPAGVATCTITPTGGGGGNRPITVSYAGSAKYLPSQDTDTFFVIVPTETGRATVVKLTAPLIGPTVIADTGGVRTEATQTKRVDVVSVPGPPLGVTVAKAMVATQFAASFAEAQVATVDVNLASVPAIKVKAVFATSQSSCAKASTGSASIGELKIGGTTIPIKTTPNYTINVGVLKVVMNEQLPFTTSDGRGLIVNAIHITALGGLIDLVVASATSDIHNCQPPPGR